MTAKDKQFTSKMIDEVGTLRNTGQTCTCLGVLLQNKEAKMVVGNYSQKNIIVASNILFKDRVVTVDDIAGGKLRGWTGPLVWDNTAATELTSQSFWEGRTVAEQADKKKPTTESMTELSRVLGEVAKLYGVNIFVVPKKDSK